MKPRNTLDAWQSEAYEYVDEIGELGFVVNLKANTASQCHLIPQEWDPDVKDWVNSTNQQVLETLAAFTGPQGGQSELIRRGFVHLEIAGESILLGSPTEEPDVPTGVVWEFLSTEELQVTRGSPEVRRRRDGQSGAETLPADIYTARMYRSHPRFSALADSPLRRVLGIAAEVLTLTQIVAATARSRLAAGILYVPEEIDFVTDDESDDVLESGDAGQVDVSSFLHELEEHLKAPIENRASAASLVPLLMRGPAELFKSIGLIEVSRGLDQYAQQLRQEALKRMAAGMDIDPIYVEGMGAATHWNGWQAENTFVVKHIEPTGGLLADFVTVAFLRPTLETFHKMRPDQSRMFRVKFDTSPIQVRADEAAAARLLYDMEGLSIEATVAANGFDVSAMPDDDELAMRRAWTLLKSSPVELGPVLGDMVGLTGVDWSKAAPAAPGGLFPTGPAPSGPDIANEMTPPAAPTDLTGLVNRVATAADMAIDRALERAGARLVSRTKSRPEFRDRFATVQKERALTLTSPSELAAAGVTVAVLLEGAWDGLALKARSWIREFAETRGRDPLTADDLAALATSNLCSSLHQLVSARLHTGMTVNGNGLRVPDRLVLDAIHAAGVV